MPPKSAVDKTVKIKKSEYNFIKQNQENVMKVLKSLSKRQQHDLPVDVVVSFQVSQSFLVKVDSSGMRPTVAAGKLAVRDMPIQNRRLRERNRRRAAQRAVTEPEQQEIEADQEQEMDQDQVEDLIEDLENDLVDLEDHV